MLGLRCGAGFSLVAVSPGAAPHCSAWAAHHRAWTVGLSSSGSCSVWSQLRCPGSVIVAHGLNCSMACGIFSDQGLNLCLLHWQADSLPLNHQGSPERREGERDFIPNLLSVFVIKECWLLSSAFSMSIETVMWVLILLLIWCIALIDFCLLN